MGLPGCREVECLEVNSSMGFAVLFRADYHAGTQGDRFTYRDQFDDAERDILIKTGFDLIPPVEWDRQGFVMGNGSTTSCMGGLFIIDRGGCSHMLKVLEW